MIPAGQDVARPKEDEVRPLAPAPPCAHVRVVALSCAVPSLPSSLPTSLSVQVSYRHVRDEQNIFEMSQRDVDELAEELRELGRRFQRDYEVPSVIEAAAMSPMELRAALSLGKSALLYEPTVRHELGMEPLQARTARGTPLPSHEPSV